MLRGTGHLVAALRASALPSAEVKSRVSLAFPQSPGEMEPDRCGRTFSGFRGVAAVLSLCRVMVSGAGSVGNDFCDAEASRGSVSPAVAHEAAVCWEPRPQERRSSTEGF